MKKTRFLKIIAAFLTAFSAIVATASVFTLSSFAAEKPNVPGVEAYCLYDKTHGKMLYGENLDSQLYTSTSAKVLSGLIFCEALSERLDESITVTKEMISYSSGYSMKLSDGEIITVRDLLYGALCGSYNDAYYVLSYAVSGSVESFVSLMNSKATVLGATSTSYTNPIGYPDNEAMMTTLSDTLKIALAASDNPLFVDITNQVKHECAQTNKSDARLFYNRNQLIAKTGSGKNYYHSECIGMNAGYSGERGGWSVITAAKDDGAELICIALGGKESEDGYKIYSYEAIHTLVDSAIREYNSFTVFEAGETVADIDISMTGIANTKAKCVTEGPLVVYVSQDALKDGLLSYEISKNQNVLTAPVTKGTEVGVVRVIYDGEIIGDCKLLLDGDYEANKIILLINSLGAYVKSRAFVATVICFLVLLAATYIYSRFKPNRFKNKKH